MNPLQGCVGILHSIGPVQETLIVMGSAWCMYSWYVCKYNWYGIVCTVGTFVSTTGTYIEHPDRLFEKT